LGLPLSVILGLPCQAPLEDVSRRGTRWRVGLPGSGLTGDLAWVSWVLRMGEPVLELDWRAPFAIDVRVTLGVQGRGKGDPTYRVDEAGAIWRTSLTPDGPATIRVLPSAPATDSTPTSASTTAGFTRTSPTSTSTASGASIAASASSPASTRVRAWGWGPGAGWLLDALPAALGRYDDVEGFDSSVHPLIRDSARSNPGFRLGRSGRLMEALVPAILEQKVVILEAHRAWRTLLSKFGTEPPGPAPAGMRVFPDPRTWRRIPSWEWHRAGVEGVRAETIIRASTVAESLERLLALSHEEADRRLRTIPGIGVWTSAEARQRAAGDPDAVSVGDYHLKNVVGWALAGKDRSSDEEMLALLEPFKGHRHRATRLIGMSRGAPLAKAAGSGPRYGVGGPPRRGPRMSVRDYRRF
jgi:3-methyladenine DNA glycosylase/8-oxoguanine DNA glycosylase